MSESFVEESGKTLLDCARYGELEEIKEVLSEAAKECQDSSEAEKQTKLASILNYRDSQGASALHKAAANGHTDIVQWLLKNGARNVANNSGNMPLHWAVQNSQTAVVQMLCESADIDVLAMNSDGKSCITYAFDGGNADILKCLLEHSSAEKLQDNVGSKEGEETVQTLELELRLAEGVNVKCREIGFASRNLEDPESLETTGAIVWAASLILSRWLLQLKTQLSGKKVVELGAGCGLPSLTLVEHCGAESVAATDLFSKTFDNLKYNVQQVQSKIEKQTKVTVVALDWKDPDTWPSGFKDGKTDIVIGADLVYDRDLVDPLVATVNNLLSPGGVFFYVSADKSRAGVIEFCKALQEKGLSMNVQDVPEDFLANPLSTDEAFNLHFGEVGTNTFHMYRFTKS